ncbi:response regulator transcription factor [Pseudobacteriovorax antillogorgiicola]|uniref:Two-component system, response regulator RegA n=1 Tax=Pseudobacteriovorax antillogorgiicola TaxID=1513793 RepID=A0A1Y6B9B4_9BACT|nr:response regulator [Pseudobacteriovorax antillogorgiicola]TCS57574.1 two-component system response regulator RegA [Pseudobacteriovorax antillogorgiicola]SME99657.1 two-component system, response regulator RegA [Pseudobacteriovorax antillogorgiicola]
MEDNARPKLLVLEDDEDFRESLILELGARGFEAYGSDNWKNLDKDRLESTQYGLVDLRLNQDSGLECLKRLKEGRPDMRVVLFTGYGTISTAVEAMKFGAANYLTKPVSMDQVVDALLDVVEEDDPVKNETESGERISLARRESEYIEYVLAKCNGNITHAADWLGIRRQSLQRKLKKFPPNR